MTSGQPRSQREDRAQAGDLLAALHQLPEDEPAARRRCASSLVELHMPLVVYLARRFSGPQRADERPRPGRRHRADQGHRPLRPRTPARVLDVRDADHPRRDQAALPRHRLADPRPAPGPGAADHAQRGPRRPEPGARPGAHRQGAGRPHRDRRGDGARGARRRPRLLRRAARRAGRARRDRCPSTRCSASSTRASSRSSSAPCCARSSPKLPEAEREILLLRFVANKTQTEIAAIVGVSQMQVSRLVARGLKRLRESLGAPEPEVEQRRRRR